MQHRRAPCLTFALHDAKQQITMAKSALKSAPVQAFIGTLLGAYMGFVGATTRWDRRGVEHITPIREGRDGLIGTIWHSRIMLSPSIWPKGAQPAKVLISRSGEGDAIAAEIYANAFNQDQEFYAFYRSISAYKSSFAGKEDLLVIDPESDFFRYLKNPTGK